MDGNDSVSSLDDSSDDSESENSEGDTKYDTDDELQPCQPQPNLFPCPDQKPSQGTPLKFDISNGPPSSLPLCMMTNARSAYNKKSNLSELLYQICPSFLILTETWERENYSLDKLLNSRVYKTISYHRKNKSRGGGCAIIYQNNDQLKFRQADIDVPDNIEVVWAICT